VKIDEHTVITGSEDGFLRGVSIYPNKIISILGKHSEDDEHFPIQRVSVSHCRNFAASCSHDSSIKFYDVAAFIKGRARLSHDGDEQYEVFENSEEVAEKGEARKGKKVKRGKNQEGMEMEDNKNLDDNGDGDEKEDEKDSNDDDNDDDDDDESSSDDEEIMGRSRLKKKKKGKKVNIKTRMNEIEREKKAKFFEGI
jgi:WD repeat-containing protein 55